MFLSEQFFKYISTMLFLSFLMIVATHIPIAAFFNDPIFRDVETKYFNFNSTNMKFYRSEGFITTNIDNSVVIIPEEQNIRSSLYDLYLGFDGNDFTNNYTIIKNQYTTNSLQKQKGNFSAKFISKDDTILLFPREESVLKNNASGLQNFTISFSLYPYRVGEGTQTIVQYKDFYVDPIKGNQQYGFSITIKNGIIFYEFENFFVDAKGIRYSLILQENKPLIDKQWEQHTLVLNSSASIIKVFRNDFEEDVVFIREQQNISSPRIHPVALDKNFKDVPLKIAQNSFFSLDEFTIYRDVITDLMNYTPHKKNFFETEVFNISKNISELYEMGIDSSDDDVSLKLAYRISEHYFLPDTSSTNLPWVYIDVNKKMFPPSYSMGKYIQWRVEYFSPPKNNNNLFYINNIFSKYKESSDPSTVVINYIKAKDGAVEISWKTIPDELIESYEIYYGEKSGCYFGKAELSPSSPISVDVEKSAVSQSVDYELVGLENEKPYYISIRAKDIYGQYGAFSAEITTRPSSVNVDFGYSINR